MLDTSALKIVQKSQTLFNSLGQELRRTTGAKTVLSKKGKKL